LGTPNRQHATDTAAMPRGMASAVATLTALLLSLAILATAPGAGFSALAGSRIVFLSDTPAAVAASPAAHQTTPGTVAPAPRVAATSTRAALSARAAVMLRHTSLPPPAAA
jgi:hypothetical protein